MTLKKFLGKTLEAAKKSARQLYGDDFVILETVRPDKDRKASITVIVDKNGRKSLTGRSGGQYRNRMDINTSSGGESGHRRSRSKTRSSGIATFDDTQQRGSASEKFVNQQKTSNGQNSGVRFERSGEEPSDPPGLYNRSALRKRQPLRNDTEPEQIKPSDDATGSPKTVSDNGHQAPDQPLNKEPERPSLLSRFDATRPKIDSDSPPAETEHRERRTGREITALHKRFDKLEALLDSALITSSFDYVSHPAFQQLVHTGISTTVVAGWFSDIIREGIDPYDQTPQFMSKLSSIIREAVSLENATDTRKYLLFTGPSGSGKTELIQKLVLHNDFMSSGNCAVVSIHPGGSRGQMYYTIMEPFCHDQEIPFYSVKAAAEVTEHLEEWDRFDHVLIDTPSIRTQQESSFREYWKLRQMLSPLTPLEVHYVVNASLDHYYFRQPSSTRHPLQPDYVDITHLDEVVRWGPIIPFLRDIGCPARYISTGHEIPESLASFDPSWFAKHLLEETREL